MRMSFFLCIFVPDLQTIGSKRWLYMSAAQAIASNKFIIAMGSMIEDEKMMNDVLGYIEYMKLKPQYPSITWTELEANGMPLHQAMNQLREKARKYYQA